MQNNLTLTAKQQNNLIDELLDWQEIESSTEKVDRELAESYVNKIYTSHNLQTPTISWLKSPLSLAVTRAFVDTLASRMKRNDPCFGKINIGKPIKNLVRNQVIDDADYLMHKSLNSTLIKSLLDTTANGWQATLRHILKDTDHLEASSNTIAQSQEINSLENTSSSITDPESQLDHIMSVLRQEIFKLDRQNQSVLSSLDHRRTYKIDPEFNDYNPFQRSPLDQFTFQFLSVDMNRLNLGVQINLNQIDPVMATIILAISWNLKRQKIPYSVIDNCLFSTELILGREISSTEQEQLQEYCMHGTLGSFLHSVKSALPESCFGQRDAKLLALHSFALKNLELDYDNQLQDLINLSKTVGGFCPHENICFLYERYSLLETNDEDRPHNTSGPAISYNNNWNIFSWRGAYVDEHVIMEPEKITIAEIDQEKNAELRRILIARYGEEKFLLDSHAQIIDDDPKIGTLYRRELEDDEPLVMVKVINSTEEPDGTRNVYFLRVPPDTRTAKEAVAWTFRLTANSYNPDKET